VVEVPAGRTPFVLSEDDVNYYPYEAGHGLGDKLVLDHAGNVAVKVGTRTTHDDLVPIVDDFVAAHPLFSAQGAKGVLAVTGYAGVLGWRTLGDGPPAIRGATAVAARLKQIGWTFASHTWGHINLTSQAGWLADDTRLWAQDVEPIVGSTDVLVYPFGAPARSGIAFLKAAGFTIQCDIDDVARMVVVDGVTIMSRRHIDGIAFRDQVANLKQFFDVATVHDPRRPPLR
jgi:peptidoglycan/xylan/chitin deacetylase (PgdA/CDA1 family)